MQCGKSYRMVGYLLTIDASSVWCADWERLDNSCALIQKKARESFGHVMSAGVAGVGSTTVKMY